jgi:hypothetical protein
MNEWYKWHRGKINTEKERMEVNEGREDERKEEKRTKEMQNKTEQL